MSCAHDPAPRARRTCVARVHARGGAVVKDMADLELWQATAETLGWIDVLAHQDQEHPELGYLVASPAGHPEHRCDVESVVGGVWHESASLALRDVAPKLPEGWYIHIGPDSVTVGTCIILNADIRCFEDVVTILATEMYDTTGDGLNRAVSRALCRALIESRK